MLVAQASQRVAQRAGGQHVQAVGGFVQHDVGGVVHEGAGQCGLHAFALAEAFGAAVQQSLHVQHLGQGLRPRLRRAVIHTVQAAEIGDVLARCQPRVQAARVAEHAHPGQSQGRVGRDFNAVHFYASGVGLYQCGGNAQCRRLARAVGAQKPRDAAVGGREVHAGNGLHHAPLAAAAGAELLVQRPHFDHRATPPLKG